MKLGKKTREINWRYLALAFILSLSLWVFVTIQDNPMAEQLFEVPVDYVNLADNLAISDKAETVKLRLSGTANILDNVAASDIRVYVDLTGAVLGQNKLRLNFDLPNNTQLSSADFTETTLLVDELAQVQLPVQVEYSGLNKLGEGYMALEPFLTPNEVVLSGAEDKLALIDKVFVTVNLGGSEANYRASLPVNVRDSFGNSLLSWVQVEPALVDVLVPVVGSQPSKLAPVRVTLSGRPAEGYVVSRVVTDPQLATVLGPQALLDNLDYIYTSAVNINGTTGTVTENVTLLAVDGVTIDRTADYAVMVVIEREESKRLRDVVVSLTNADANYNYTLDVNTVDVEVRGAASAVNGMTSAEVTASLDVGGLVPGVNILPVQAATGSNVQIVTAEPLYIQVNVSEKQQ